MPYQADPRKGLWAFFLPTRADGELRGFRSIVALAEDLRRCWLPRPRRNARVPTIVRETKMDDVERLRSEADAHKSMAEKPGRRRPHEDLLVRYLGAVTYQPRREAPRHDRQETGGADVPADVRDGEAVRGKSRRHWWRAR
jgi:hypothetical protein